jgi:peptidyl-prolyl cis-trans isomerase-like 4
LEKRKRESEAKAQALTLEMVGDLPSADIKPPENILFVCKLNPVTTDEDLELIFSRFGPIRSCEIVRDKKTGDSLQFAFIEFENKEDCEEAYFKMNNVMIDDRRIFVDFSQSVSKLHGEWFERRKSKLDSLKLKKQYDRDNTGDYDLLFDHHKKKPRDKRRKESHHRTDKYDDKERSHRNSSHEERNAREDKYRKYDDRPRRRSRSR